MTDKQFHDQVKSVSLQIKDLELVSGAELAFGSWQSYQYQVKGDINASERGYQAARLKNKSIREIAKTLGGTKLQLGTALKRKKYTAELTNIARLGRPWKKSKVDD